MDFFEDQLAALGNDWKKLVEKFLLSGKEPLINNLICGRMSPLFYAGEDFHADVSSWPSHDPHALRL